MKICLILRIYMVHSRFPTDNFNARFKLYIEKQISNDKIENPNDSQY